MAIPKHISEVRGWIAPALRILLECLTWPGICILGHPRVSTSLSHEDHVAFSKMRAIKVDTFIVACMMIDTASLCWIAAVPGGSLRIVAIIFVAWRIVDVLATSLRVSLFDEFDSTIDRYVYSAPTRVIVLGLLNYVELVVCFAALYAIAGSHIATSNKDIVWVLGEVIEKPLHLSWITQLTVGYGDFFPNSWLRPVSWLQGASGLTIVGILIARYMSAMPNTMERGGEPRVGHGAAEKPDAIG